jgi:hypothetical protein
VFDEFPTVLNMMLKDRVAGFSVPTANATFKVPRFRLDGSNEALMAVNKAMEAKTKPVGMKDEVL